jgi:anti-sigma factor RsiW
MTCAEVREAAAELVLGTLDGSARAAVVTHLAACPACRAEVESLTRVTDALWLSAPEAEPSPGFETRVLRAYGGEPARPRRALRRVLAAAAAVALLAAGIAVGSLRTARPAQAAGAMLDQTHAPVGHAVVAAGAVPYLFVTVDSWAHSGDYVVEVVRHDGSHVAVAPIHLDGGRGAAGARLPVPYRDVRAVWVSDPAHLEWCGFVLPG